MVCLVFRTHRIRPDTSVLFSSTRAYFYCKCHSANISARGTAYSLPVPEHRLLMKITVKNLVFTSFTFIIQWIGCSSRLYECLIPFEYCLSPLLTIGNSMLSVDMAAVIEHLNEQCGNMDAVLTCTRRFQCRDGPMQQKMETYIHFFQWLCLQTRILEENVQCWEYPFGNDVITCGELYIAGHLGSYLTEVNHPCPYIQQMVVCLRDRMVERDECSPGATQLYEDIIRRSSVAFASCRP